VGKSHTGGGQDFRSVLRSSPTRYTYFHSQWFMQSVAWGVNLTSEICEGRCLIGRHIFRVASVQLMNPRLNR